MTERGYLPESEESLALLRQAESGNPRALGELLLRYESRLLKAVTLRMDRRLRGRIDPADVVQETYAEASVRFQDFTRQEKMSFFLWLRFLTLQKLAQVHREHLGVQARDAGREVSIYDAPSPQATSAVLAAQLMGKHTSPSQAAVRREIQQQLDRALESMDALDREVLALRHFEQLSNAEAAQVLKISASAASTRYVRAIRRLKHLLDQAQSPAARPPQHG